MYKSARSRAEARFAATQAKYKKAQKEKDKERANRAAQMEKLKALRLAKETAESEAPKASGSRPPAAVDHSDSERKADEHIENESGEDLLAIPPTLRR